MVVDTYAGERDAWREGGMAMGKPPLKLPVFMHVQENIVRKCSIRSEMEPTVSDQLFCDGPLVRAQSRQRSMMTGARACARVPSIRSIPARLIFAEELLRCLVVAIGVPLTGEFVGVDPGDHFSHSKPERAVAQGSREDDELANFYLRRDVLVTLCVDGSSLWFCQVLPCRDGGGSIV